jgi:hypothetical protein
MALMMVSSPLKPGISPCSKPWVALAFQSKPSQKKKRKEKKKKEKKKLRFALNLIFISPFLLNQCINFNLSTWTRAGSTNMYLIVDPNLGHDVWDTYYVEPTSNFYWKWLFAW